MLGRGGRRSCAEAREAATLAGTTTGTALARCAKRRVLTHSSTFCASARSVTTIAAAHLPPRLGCSRRVSFALRHQRRPARSSSPPSCGARAMSCQRRAL